MDHNPHVAALAGGESDEYRDYAKAERRQSLFRVLAANMVRELRNSGYHGSDLLGFVSQLMQVITEEGFEEPAQESVAAPRRMPVDEARPGRGASLVGARVVLRAPAEADRRALQRWLKDPLVKSSLSPPLLEETLRHLSEGDQQGRVDFVVCERESATPFGLVSLHDIDEESGQAELAKVIGDPRFRGKGLAVAATSLLLGHGFRRLGLERIYLRTLGGNLTNIRLNERIGFRFEGVLRKALVWEGRPRDVVLMAMLRSEFEELHSGADVA